jgi:hypothetical protein
MESDDPLDMIHDSAGLTGGVDGALVLKRRRGEADANLFGDGRDFENPVELALKWNASATTWTIIGDAEEYGMSEQRRAILGVVKSADKPLGPKEITERLNASGTEMNHGAVRELCSQMAKDGQLRNPARGQYHAPGSTEDA